MEGTAGAIHGVFQSVRNKNTDRLLAHARDMAKRKPELAFSAAAALEFSAFRVMSPGSSEPQFRRRDGIGLRKVPFPPDLLTNLVIEKTKDEVSRRRRSSSWRALSLRQKFGAFIVMALIEVAIFAVALPNRFSK